MRIVLTCRIHPFHRPGGMPFVLHDRARALFKLGHDVFVLTTGGLTATEPVPYTLLAVKDSRPQEWTREFAEGCTELCRKIQPDLIHSDSFDRRHMWWVDKPGGAKRTGVTMHGFGFGAFLTRWNRYIYNGAEGCEFDPADLKAEAQALAQADVVFGVSQHEYHMLHEFYGLKQAELLYNPIMDEFFATRMTEPPADAPWLCAAISGHNNRGFHIAEEASERSGVPLLVVRDKTRAEMIAVHDQCRGVVLPTFYSQGYDLTVAEALTRGRRVIASDVGSYRLEAAAYRRQGYKSFETFPCKDVAALARRMTAKAEFMPCYTRLHEPAKHAKEWLMRMEGDIAAPANLGSK